MKLEDVGPFRIGEVPMISSAEQQIRDLVSINRVIFDNRTGVAMEARVRVWDDGTMIVILEPATDAG